MKKFKVTYIEGDTINKTAIIEGETFAEAVTKFVVENLNIIDITKVETIEND